MNQILQNKFNIDDKNINKTNKSLKIMFILFLIIALILIIYYIFFKYSLWKKNLYSNELLSNYKIMTLYKEVETKSQYNTENLNLENNTSAFVIGLIEIPKIDLLYPILSETTDSLLEISPCRFYGPMPNTVGNLCIAGHNYANNKIFGKLYLMKIDDLINIYDYYGNKIEYKIYYDAEIEATDLSCLNQDTKGLKEITLITCNTINGKRHILKAKENR